LFWVKGRLPITQSNALRPVDFHFMKEVPFWLFEIGAVLQSLAFFLPPLWLPSFAASLGMPAFSGALGLAFINLTTCFGAVLVGLLVDRFHISVAIAIVTVGQSIAIFVFWGLTLTQGMLYAFALVWGLFGGGYSSTWSGVAGALGRSTSSGRVDTGMLLSLMAAARGVGAVITGPLSETLLQAGWKANAGFAYGTNYGILIVFSGVFASLGGIACVGRVLKMI
jgi:MFS family permease